VDVRCSNATNHAIVAKRRKRAEGLSGFKKVTMPEAHPLFRIFPGGVRDWEKREFTASGGVRRQRAAVVSGMSPKVRAQQGPIRWSAAPEGRSFAL